LLLASRRGGAAAGTNDLIVELTALGADVRVVACDVSKRSSVEAMLNGIDDDAPLSAVIHAAGVLDDAVISALTAQQTRRVLAPKVDGALHLDELTRDLDLAAFVLPSSAAPMLGGQGQGNYAAANGVLDALAQARRSTGRPAHSLAWGLWTVGMADAINGDDAERYTRQIRTRLGLIPIDVESGMALFDRAIATDRANPVTALLDIAALADKADAGTLPTVMRDMIRGSRPVQLGAASRRQTVVHPSGLDAASVLSEICAATAVVLGHASGDAIDPHAPFTELGIDSLGAVELRNRLSQLTGMAFRATVIFDHPTAHELAQLVRSRMSEHGPEVKEQSSSARGSITELVSAAHHRGELSKALPMLASGSSLMTTFSASEAAAHRPELQVLARGAQTPALICIPSFLAGSGTHQFARLAREFGGERAVNAMRLPGLRENDNLPATWAAMIDSLAGVVASEREQHPVVLVGYSAGGAIAHAVARRLEDDGIDLTGVAMIDTYSPDEFEPNRVVLTAALGEILSWDNPLTPVDDHSLIAMGAYSQIYDERVARSITTPTLNLRARTTLGSLDDLDLDPIPEWQNRGTTEFVDADHFSIVESRSAETAARLRRWIASIDA
jgi:pimeloyl-ACP methyl ester carboxylesterase/acyl carrier protein